VATDRSAEAGSTDGASADLPDDSVRDEDIRDGDMGAAAPDDGKGRPRRGSGDDGPRGRSRVSLPLVPVLSVLLVLLLAGGAFLWLTRPDASAVRTADYVGALQAARSGVVDMTSFDYLTLDDDIAQIKRVATGDLEKQAVDQLDSRRKAITDAQTVVSTEVVGTGSGAGVTRATDSEATVLLVIQSTQQSAASTQAQIVRYRIQVDLVKKNDRWLLSAISGTEQP
jgi:hypothetical protein